MKVVLVAIHTHPSPQAVPLANAFLKTALAADGRMHRLVDTVLADFFCADSSTMIAQTILDLEPDAVGFSCYVWNRDLCIASAAALRMARPGLTLFAGGPEVTGDPAGLLQAGPFDFLIVGEGETPFVEAIARLSHETAVAGIAGIALRHESVPRSLPAPGPLLDTIHSPYLAGALPAVRYPGALWQLSRGCDFACSFCFDRKGGQGVRSFSMERIKAELDWFARNQVSQVFVLDSTFNRNMKQAKEILRLIGKLAPHIHFHFEVRSEFLDPEMARLFARLNCSLQIGLQSSDPQVLKGVRRIFSPADFVAKINMLNQAGCVFGFDLIYGLPGDSLAGFEKSLDFALGLYPNHLDIFPLAVLPGTELAERAESLGLKCLLQAPYTVVGTPSFTAAELGTAGRLASACDIFYSRGKAVAWFHTMLKPLRLSPSAFLNGFDRWLTDRRGRATEEAELSDEEVWQAQRDYLAHLFTGRRLKKLLPALLDLVDYHYHYAAVVMAPQPDLPTDRELEQTDLLQVPFVLSPSARLATFNFEIVDLLEAGEVELAEFTSCFSPSCSWGVIYPREEEVFTESLIEPYFRLLEQLDGSTPVGTIAARLGVAAAEAASFMEFAAAEGIARRAS